MEDFTPAEEEIRAHADAESTASKPPNPRQRYIDGLRVLASALENNEHVPLPYEGSGSTITIHFLHGEDPREAMAAAARAIPCAWRKHPWEGGGVAYFDLLGDLGGLKMKLVAYRETVCKRVVTGTRQVTEKVKDPAKLAEVPEIEVTTFVEDVEWDCGSLLAPRLPEAAPKALAGGTRGGGKPVPAGTEAA